MSLSCSLEKMIEKVIDMDEFTDNTGEKGHMNKKETDRERGKRRLLLLYKGKWMTL